MKVLLLDRDGTVIVEPPDGRVDSLDKIQLFSDSFPALTFLADHDFSVVFVTNQRGVAEGRITENEFWVMHQVMLRELAPSGIKVLKTYMNGEAPGVHASQWRKPGPNMLLQAAKDFGFSLADTYMVGDSETDIQAANSAGCKGGILVQTATRGLIESPQAVFTAPHLLDAVHYVVANT